MTIDAALEALTQGMDVLEETSFSDESLRGMRLGSLGKTIIDLREIYFGTTNATNKQAEARTLGANHALEDLRVIESYVNQLDNQGHAWAFRLELLALPIHRIRKDAPELLKDRNTEKQRECGVKSSFHKDGTARLTITADRKALSPVIKALQTDDPVKDFLENFGGKSKRQLITNLIVPLPAAVRILNGDGDDVILQGTDGSQWTGAQWLAALLEEDTFGTLATQFNAALFHPMAGPTNAYTTDRLANPKQRLLAKLECPTCAVPDCQRPAEYGQIHHIDAYSKGGPTNQSNLTVLCRYHNGTNDDDPEHFRRYGHIVRQNGTLYWESPKKRKLIRVATTPLEQVPPDWLPPDIWAASTAPPDP